MSSDGSNYDTVFTTSGRSAAPGEWISHDIEPPVLGRFVRLVVTKTRRYAANGLYYVQLAELEVWESQAVPGSVLVQWTAPGNNGDSGGPATGYQLCYSKEENDVFNAFCSPAGTGTLLSPGSLPIPGPPGTTETFAVTGLDPETRYYIAVKTVDGAANLSEISTPPGFYIDTPGTPPAAVTDFRATGVTGNSIDLAWTATWDDGTEYMASTYHLCRSTQPINEANFCTGPDATLTEWTVTEVYPNPDGRTVDGLDNETTYYFGLKASDELGNRSPLVTASETTLDVLPPDPVGSFGTTAGAIVLNEVPVTAVGVSGEASASWSKEMATDGDLATAWSTPPRATMQQEWLTVDTRALRAIGRVRLRSRTGSGELMPRELQIQVSDNPNGPFVTVHTGSITDPQAGQWYSFPIPVPATGRFVKLLITQTRLYAPNQSYYVQLAEMAVDEVTLNVVPDQVTLSWTASGDDGSLGQVLEYQLCYSDQLAHVESFCTVPEPAPTPVSIPAVAPPGGTDHFVVPGLQVETTYYFAIRAFDEAGNFSASVQAQFTTPSIPPAPITDLAASLATVSTVHLSWTATGDDATSGMAQQYQLCYSSSPIDEGNFCVGDDPPSPHFRSPPRHYPEKATRSRAFTTAPSTTSRFERSMTPGTAPIYPTWRAHAQPTPPTPNPSSMGSQRRFPGFGISDFHLGNPRGLRFRATRRGNHTSDV